MQHSSIHDGLYNKPFLVWQRQAYIGSVALPNYYDIVEIESFLDIVTLHGQSAMYLISHEPWCEIPSQGWHTLDKIFDRELDWCFKNIV